MSSWLVEQLDETSSPLTVAQGCRSRCDQTIFFDSQSPGGQRARFSLVLCQPTKWLSEEQGLYREGPSQREVDDPRRWLVDASTSKAATSEIPFVGGLAGYLGFELGWALDDVAYPKPECESPDLWVGRFEHAAIYDHHHQSWWLCFSGPEARDSFKGWWAELFGELEAQDAHRPPGARWRCEVEPPSRASWIEKAQRGIDDIYAGEFFEVNYTERFQGLFDGDFGAFYADLRQRAPGQFGGLIDIPELQIASISPEQFLQIKASGEVITRPIKGTRPRGASGAEDHQWAEELKNSLKDRAENTMIVDLMRNDLTRICKLGTVDVSEWCKLYSFSSVHHLISTVEGELLDEFTPIDALLACFPAGSITGAPKLRAMEWIAETEATPRGPYTGSLFYASDHGRLDSNVLIRSAVIADGELRYGSGGALVSDSDPSSEYEEACWKARPIMAPSDE